ncbi:MJ0041-family pseudouridylate synthase Zn finger thump [Cryptosporidium bovis]|uniref:MJ0041-family pseudouridylate synthase Zn finger thump n=1 Tax=Cryptosporidium bovis TaxID=310047 RepID=UPI00351A9393|nr:MJ0041-family pseudouridylate synthase Zn finger thump [Cryptosporidium bovis]
MDISDSYYHCWRCKLRLDKVTVSTNDYLFGSLWESEQNNKDKIENIINKRCDLCKDLLLIDNYNIFYVEKVSNEVIKTKRKRSNRKSNISFSNNDRPLNNGFTFYVYKHKKINDNSNNNVKYSINDQTNVSNCVRNNESKIKDIFELILNKAVNGDKMYKIRDFGISIELSPELRENTEKNISIKSCLRQLLVSQINIAMLNQESDLFINFSFSTNTSNKQINSNVNNINCNINDDSDLVFKILVSFKWRDIYMIGRYIKLSRRISQSKWNYKDDNVVVDTSIEELLENSLNDMVKFSNITFSSSGREDIDVRMLGTDILKDCDNNSECDENNVLGRPFAIEVSGISNNYNLFYNNVDFCNIDNNHNNERNYDYSIKDFIAEYIDKVKLLSKSRLIINCLDITNVFMVNKMNKQVNEKEKSYVCVCYSPIKFSNEDYCILSNKIINNSISINQRTPIRVLHRRVNIDRVRNIVIIKIVEINQNYFILYLKTQSGTYIKEFIHGDFGRTNPSFGDLIVKHLPKKKIHDKLEISIVQLDVLNVM